MHTDKAIYTECYVDSNLIETLVPSDTGYNKKNGCNNVAKVMKENSGSFAVGIVDRDKNQLDYLKEFRKVDEVDSLILWRHADENIHHYIIQIAPAVEKWILKIVADLGLDMQEFGLPNNFRALGDYAKKRASKNDPSFKKLFSKLKAADHPIIKKLIYWVTTLKKQKHNVTIEELKEIN